MRLAIVTTVLGAGLAAIWPVYPVLCLSALLCGGAVGAATIALQRHVGRLAAGPGELREVFSWVSTAPAVSNFLGPFAAGLLIDHGGYRAAFGFLAVMPLLAWALLRGSAKSRSRQPAHRSRRPGTCCAILAFGA